MVKKDFFLTSPDVFPARAGFTLMEIMIALLLVTLVFLAGVSVYTTGFKFLQTAQTTDVTTIPVVSLEALAKRISVGNLATVNFAGPVTGGLLHVRADFAAIPASCGTYVPLNTPGNTADDGWWHFYFRNGVSGPALYSVCDNNPGTNPAGGPPSLVLITNAVLGNCAFTLTNPSAAGIPTVVNIHVQTTVPVSELDTDVAIGALPKR